jgi:hypothetical protein
MKKLLIVLLGIILIVNANAQNTDKKSRKEIKAEKAAQQKEQTQKLIENKTFEFIAEQAMPAKGRAISISSYNVKIFGDSIISHLPYYGRAYTPPITASSSPLDFNTVAEEFTETKNDKKYELEYKIRYDNDNIVYKFEIFHSGSASLYVRSNNRQPITYHGRIGELRLKKK